MEWTYEDHTSPIGETGDSSTETKITNGKLTFYVSDCELEDEELDTLCELLNQMPNLWCAELDALEFEKAHPEIEKPKI